MLGMRSPRKKNALQQSLIAGRDYPSTYSEFVEMFSNDEACVTYLFLLRKPLSLTEDPAKFYRSGESVNDFLAGSVALRFLGAI